MKTKNNTYPATRNSQLVSVPTRLLNTPLMVDHDAAHLILKALGDGFTAADIRAFFLQGPREAAALPDQPTIAVIPVIGGLTYRGYGWFWRMTYGEIKAAFRQALADPEIEAIVFDIDSPGGETAGVFDLVDEIYQARGQKPTFAIANEDAFSAAYAIASAADKVYLSRTASVGSVGVIAVHVEQSGFDQKLGVKYTSIFAGKHKNDFSVHEPLSDAAKKVAADRVNSVYDIFCETVARNRDLTVKEVKETEAAIYRGGEAVQARLADEVLSWDQAMQKILSTIEKKGDLFMKLTIADLKTGLEAILADESGQKEAVAMLAGFGFVPRDAAPDQAEIEKLITEATENGKKEGTDNAVKRAVEIVNLCNLAELPQMAVEQIESGDTVKDIRQKITDAKAKADGEKDQVIHSTIGATTIGEVNPLIADAQRRADSKK